MKKVIDARDEVLPRYQPVFTPDHIASLTAIEFNGFLQFDNNLHWTNLTRKTSHVCDDLPKLKEALSLLLDEGQPLAGRIDRLLLKTKSKFIKGFGKALATAILHIAHSDKYGVWNGTSEKGMKVIGVWPTFQHGCTMGECYQQINDVLNRLKAVLGIDLWTLDALWWRAKSLNLIPEEILAPERFKEGAIRQIAVNAYERSEKAREKCIDHYGYECAVCEHILADFYGKVAKEVIHVHHLKDLATVGEEYEVDPIKHLRPVCPNCHAVLHTETPAMSISKLRKILDKFKKK
jgi:hypothetical protein